MILIIIRHSEKRKINWPGTAIALFLDWNVKHAADSNLKELAYFALSSYCLNYLGLRISGEPSVDDDFDVLMKDETIPQLDKNQIKIISMMNENVLQSVL